VIHRFLFAGIVACRVSIAAPAEPTDSAWHARVWQSDDGLPNNTVSSLAQTEDGYLWAVTAGRLARFDGIRFEEVTSDDIVAGCHKRIGTLLQSRHGGLWIAMDHGPVVYLKSGAAQVFTNDLVSELPTGLAEEGDDTLWIAYRGGSVCRLQNGHVTQLSPRSAIRPPASDTQGRVWFPDGGAVGRFSDGNFVESLKLPANTIRLTGASRGGIWLCAGYHLYKFDPGSPLQDFGAFKPDEPGDQPTVLLEARDGAVWIGTQDSGLVRFDGSHFENVPTSHRAILSLLEDREGTLWVGTGGGGLDCIQRREVALETTDTGLPFETVQSVCEDAEGAIWVVTQNGAVARRSAVGWSVVSAGTNWPGGRASCVVADPSGAVWIGTRDHAVHCWKDGRFTSLERGDGIIGQHVHALLASRSGDLWIAAVGGRVADSVQRLRSGRLQTFDVPHNIRTIRAMVEDAAGNIWAGTVQGVLLRFSGDAVTDETARIFPGPNWPPAGSPMSIRSLYAAPDGSLWIGFAGAGLGRLKDGRFVRITRDAGLYDDHISQIIADDRGCLWFGTDRGIFKVQESDLRNVAEGRASRLQSVHYGRNAVLPGLQADFGFSPGAWRDRDGRLWLPMSTALAVVDPSRLPEESAPPPVLLQRVSLDEKTVAMYGGVLPVRTGVALQKPQTVVKLPPVHRRLEFEFTALSFRAPENVQFRCRLTGMDDEWTELGTQRRAVYSRLPAGNYEFQVKACNSDGIWNEQAATFAFGVEPVWWQTGWFRLAALALFMSGTIAVVRYTSFRRLRWRLQQVERQAALDRERSRIAKDLHDSLGADVTEIGLLADSARLDAVSARDQKRLAMVLAERARVVARSLDSIVWTVNPQNDSLDRLAGYLCDAFQELFRRSPIASRLDVARPIPPLGLTPEERSNLFLAAKEAMNNILKHSGASQAWLRMKMDGGCFQISIEDNGGGFNLESPPADGQNGINNMRSRLEEIHGTFTVSSVPGRGTRVEFSVPFAGRNGIGRTGPGTPLERA